MDINLHRMFYRKDWVKVGIFLLASLVNIVGAICPAGCLCYLDHEPRKVVCSNQGLDEYPKGISDLVEHLDLSGNNLRLISTDIGRLIELRYLNLSKNQLNGLPEEIGELWKLERLDLSENNIRDVSSGIGVITRLTSLQILYLGINPITDLQELSNAALRALDVNRCSILRVNNDSLNGLPELVSLNMQDNPLITIQPMKSHKLKWLDMSKCRLNFLKPDTFEGLPELEQLRLANNPFLVYSTRKETLKHDKLKRLDASGCNLDRPGLHGFPSLTQAILSRNMIRFLPDRIFSRNKMLINLSLKLNGLDLINGSSFSGMPVLETLDLSGNNLNHLPPTAFKDNVNLRLLNLSNNEIRKFPSSLIMSATTLDLSANLIDDIPKKALSNMSRIKSLDLSRNRLESFSSGLESETLKTLILESNRLTKLTNVSFIHLPSLSKINLAGNRFSEGPPYEIFLLNDHLQTILLHDNPWNCGCQQLSPIYNFVTKSGKTSSSSLVCQSPSNVSGFLWSFACHSEWTNKNSTSLGKERVYQFVLMGLFICILIFGSVISIGHTVRTKRQQAILRLREAERAEARERVILHRRSIESEMNRQENQPRVHPQELIGPPTYDEAVQMPRLARSLDNLESMSGEGLGNSGQSLDQEAWAKKRRMQSRKRIGKRARSEDQLNTRTVDRTRSSERISKDRSMSIPRQSIIIKKSKEFMTERSNNRRMNSESEEPTSSADGYWNKSKSRISISSRKKRRPLMKRDGHSSDDEDSDIQRNSTAPFIQNVEVIVLPREPRSGAYRPPGLSSPSSPPMTSSPESCETTGQIFRSQIV